MKLLLLTLAALLLLVLGNEFILKDMFGIFLLPEREHEDEKKYD